MKVTCPKHLKFIDSCHKSEFLKYILRQVLMALVFYVPTLVFKIFYVNENARDENQLPAQGFYLSFFPSVTLYLGTVSPNGGNACCSEQVNRKNWIFVCLSMVGFSSKWSSSKGSCVHG